jgi:hypothetical protein
VKDKISNMIQSPELELALDENTPSQTLRELAQSENENIRYAVAQNPNTSPEVRSQNPKSKDAIYPVSRNPKSKI